MLLIVGLGNPGEEYRAARHNFGFMAADALAAASEAIFSNQKRFTAAIAEMHEARNHLGKVILAKPHTFMNLSGKCVAGLAQFYKLDPKNIWVIADDLDLPLGKIRIRHGGDSGGHHGIDSVAQELGTTAFGRIRLGVRGDALRLEHLENSIDAQEFLLRPFEDREKQFVDRTLSLVATVIKEAMTTGELKAHTWEIEGFDESVARLT